MTLAILFLFWMSHAFAPASLAQDQGSPAPQSQASAPQAQNPPSSTATPSSSTPSKPPGAKQAKKKKPAVNCDNAPASGPAPAASAGTGDATPAQTSTSAPPTNTAPANCPPTKRIVRQGGTSEPSIQLAGGDPASPQSDNINQMLASADDNLKKLSGRTLSSDQQGTVNQIHLFEDLSRKALKGGDLDRARTLAWKAQSLSQELVNPQQ